MSFEILQGDSLLLLRALQAGSARCVVTSPPYWGLRDYGTAPEYCAMARRRIAGPLFA